MRDFPFIRVYINNFIIYLNSLKEHKHYLRKVFKKLDSLRFLLAAKKLFLRYPLVIILGQKVNALGLALIDKRIKVIRDL